MSSRSDEVLLTIDPLRKKGCYSCWIHALLLLSSLLTAGCAMGPDYLRPHIDTADKFRITQMEGQSIANLP
ncbi:MAG: hypothetical protein AABY47_01725, partial [Pseudomonadota bacterium]